MSNDIVLKLVLLPFSILFGIAVSLRELLYRFGLVKSVQFSIPIIGVGNLSVGGTGKTPHVEYLLQWLDQYVQVSTLSRGYGRKTVGMREVLVNDSVEAAGDEPLQYKRKWPHIPVFVAENRALGIPGIVQRYPNMQVVLLDDAFQHRAVKPGKQILLTEYNRPYTRDWLLPSGRLREWRNAARRADLILVTKCPADLSAEQRAAMITEIEPAKHQKVYFSRYQFGAPYHLWDRRLNLDLNESLDALLVSALAGTEYLVDQLSTEIGSLRSLAFKDHHLFEADDFETIKRDFNHLQSSNKVILCTEKDAVKLERFVPRFAQEGISVFVLPVRVQFLGDDERAFRGEIELFLSEFKS
jgi:tetraacyldisaccharide 4'-kinase